MIGGFVRARLGGFSDADLDALEALLELPDVDLADWLTGRRAIPMAGSDDTGAHWDVVLPMLLRIKESLTR